MAINDLINAANAASGGVPGNALNPMNCHEAVLGWLLMARSAHFCNNFDPTRWPAHWISKPPAQIVPWAWVTVRELAARHGVQGVGLVSKQLEGKWFGTKLYPDGVRVLRPAAGAPWPPHTVSVGDVISMGVPQIPHHSMVVVQYNGPGPGPLFAGPQAFARGFNNAGAFGQGGQVVGGYGGAPFMAWDPNLRDILNVAYWNVNSEFLGRNGPAPIHHISYAQVIARIPFAEVWGHVHFAMR
jgi:hypothetical protein